ncbi:hypothetical protein TDB9533_01984 [Thalassocella blandensis]|nr:hypothetical protein TDB9533_01984 [Thalassocella blandensis]
MWSRKKVRFVLVLFSVSQWFLLVSACSKNETDNPLKEIKTNEAPRTKEALKVDAPDVESTQIIKPRWTDSFSLPGLLAEAVQNWTGNRGSNRDIGILMDKPWYSKVKVKTTEAEVAKTIGSCSEYFSVKTPDIRADNQNEQNAFLELQIACEAARLLADMKPSGKSFLDASVVDQQLPLEIPKIIAMSTSTSEFKVAMEDTSKEVWSDINSIRNFEKISDSQANYISDAGTQTITEIGRGDLNDDGIEDVVIVSQDVVEGGSYFNLRLFSMSLDQNERWVVIGQFPTL